MNKKDREKVEELKERAVFYNKAVLESKRGAIISGNAPMIRDLHRVMYELKHDGHSVSYTVGIISIKVDGKEVM